MIEFNFSPFPVLQTERLFLREITKKDLQQLFLLRSNEEAMKYIDRPRPVSIEEIKPFIKLITKNTKENNAVCWAITLKNANELVGTISYHRTDKQNHRAEIGYMLLPEFWGKGLMGEALPKVIGYGFTKMKLHSIEANINPNNEASRKILQKFGFKTEAFFKENYFYNGKFLDSEILCLVNNKV